MCVQIRGHSDLILKVAWCKANELIVSGGEDCYYKVYVYLINIFLYNI